MALGPYEISVKIRVAKKIGQNWTVQVDHQDFCMSRQFAGGATLTQTRQGFRALIDAEIVQK